MSLDGQIVRVVGDRLRAKCSRDSPVQTQDRCDVGALVELSLLSVPVHAGQRQARRDLAQFLRVLAELIPNKGADTHGVRVLVIKENLSGTTNGASMFV